MDSLRLAVTEATWSPTRRSAISTARSWAEGGAKTHDCAPTTMETANLGAGTRWHLTPQPLPWPRR